jgi:hypothetical protein
MSNYDQNYDYSSTDRAVQQILGNTTTTNESVFVSGGGSYAGSSFGTAGGASFATAGANSFGAAGGSYSSGEIVSSSVVSAGSAVGGLSEIEAAILRSTVPISVNETEEITVLGQRGVWANRQEISNWRGVIPITQYVINEDNNPEIITKRTQEQLTYIQGIFKFFFLMPKNRKIVFPTFLN